jgi:Zn finger protein HypA/HybF involved in hydrogenase expression
MATMNNQPINIGAALASLRPRIEKACESCGEIFTGLKRKVLCEKCRSRNKQRAYMERKKSNQKR